ncbi:hypothetical protein BFJ72_g13470 [Fusarium proliferatum]|uniref:Uncharacterized protein n=1 Tax=Gibberella intermedia TaxID=948311 RepID=A0A420SCE4_GIBIN|nr:hypothetical protein BFJ72_g13470 [Fusarium proliferatum]
MCTKKIVTNKISSIKEVKDESWADMMSNVDDLTEILIANLNLGKNENQSESGSQHVDRTMLERVKQTKTGKRDTMNPIE